MNHNAEISRRKFLEFLGRGAASLQVAAGMGLMLPARDVFGLGNSNSQFPWISPSSKDDVVLGEGLSYSVIAKLDDAINPAGEKFGNDNDFTAFFPLSEKEGILWVNHESPEHLTLLDKNKIKLPRPKEEVLKEMRSVGGTILKIRKSLDGHWKFNPSDSFNRRITASTSFNFSGGQPIAGSRRAVGTVANCCGGVTPWGTVLSCEENYQDFYGETADSGIHEPGEYGWDTVFKRPPEHYGWVVEINPKTGKGTKLVDAGRFCHEGATTTLTKDGRCVFYSGDDASDECLYKFVAKRPGSLQEGTLYVANLSKGQWIALDHSSHPALKKKFKDQLDVLIHARRAAHLVGGTPLHRPEGVAIDPKTNSVLVALTNHKKKGDYYGSILKIEEDNKDAASTTFRSAEFIPGGENSGFACPDNIVFDPHGDLWITTDISGKSVGKSPYKKFKHNGLFFVPMSGPKAGTAIQVASAPTDSEFTGPSFSPDGTLFLSVQHPGELSKSETSLTSRWPKGSKLPSSAIISITGPFLKNMRKYA